jgi:hypothetical protein
MLSALTCSNFFCFIHINLDKINLGHLVAHLFEYGTDELTRPAPELNINNNDMAGLVDESSYIKKTNVLAIGTRF